MLERPNSKAEWTRVAFGDVVRKVSDKIDPWESGLERYVAGEHMDTDDLRIRHWGLIGDNYLGPAFHMRFRPGHVLYGSRRTYLRKVAVAEFEGITANTTFVLETKNAYRLLPELLPFVMQTEAFHNYSIQHSKGSVNPYINFSDLEAFEFLLPPIQEQVRLVQAFVSFDDARETLRRLSDRSRDLLFSTASELLHQHDLSTLAAGSPSPATGWRNVSFNDVCERITYGFTNPMPTTDVGPWMVTAKDVVDGRINYESARHTSQDAFDTDLTNKSRVQVGDVLLTKDGTLGRVAVVDRNDVCVNQSVAVLRTSQEATGVFLSQVLRAPQMQARLLQDSGGSAVKHLYITKVGETRFFLPGIEFQLRITGVLDNLQDTVNASIIRLSKLNDIRRSILEGELSHAL